MKRSEINKALKELEAMCETYKCYLPPFCQFTPEEWQTKGHEYDEIRDCMLGWDITDFGLGRFDEFGFSLITIRNGCRTQPEKYPKVYAEKLLYLKEGQMAANHFHWYKTEDIINRGGGTLAWTAHASEPWVVLSKSAGKTADEERITVGIDWEKAPSGNAVPAQIVFRAGEQSEKVLVSLFNPTAPSRAELRGIYVENNGCVSIPAAGCHRVRENDRIKITVVEDLGIEGPALQLGDPTAPLQIFRSRDVPCAEYDFYAFDAGSVDVYTYVLPTFPLHADRDFRIGENTNTDTKYSVQIDDGALATPSSSHVEYAQVWFESVLRNCAVNKSTLHIDKPGRHTLRIRVGDPGIVLQKIVLDFGGMKRSYLGPQSTLIE